MTTFSSKDFSKVPSKLSITIPDHLSHQQVCGGSNDPAKKTFNEERQHPVHIVDLPSKTMSMTIGELKPSQASRPHRHTYETLIYIIRGNGKTIIEDREVVWQADDALYIPVWCWHHHINLSNQDECIYIGCENAPMLQNLGELAIREEYTKTNERREHHV